MLKKAIIMAALVLVLVPASSRADGLFSANIGTTFAGAAKDMEHLTYGASVGWMGAGIFGVEANFDYTPGFFKPKNTSVNLIDKSNVTSIMANVILGIPVGGQTGPGVRPYASGGVGLLKTNVEDAKQLFTVHNNDFGVNIGAGVYGFFADHVGIRGDVRYYRALSDPQEDNEFDIDFGSFNFWRGTAGLALRW